ncbi:MAG: PAS domain-containing protein [Clostridia bacterium]
MSIINTRSHIVLDKEGLKNYADLLNLSYGGIVEINTKLDAYQVLCYTEKRFPGINAGTGRELVTTVKKYVHKEDRKRLFSAFRRKKLRSIIQNNEHESVDFRGRLPEGTYRWMRAFLIPDETANDTVLCLLLDIEIQKRCEMLEQENQQLRKQLEQYSLIPETMKAKAVKSEKKIFGVSLDKRKLRSFTGKSSAEQIK